jgi:hypothetical protein
MKPTIRFQIGDRVRITRYFAGIAVGSTGTVIHIFITSRYCDVRFDGFHQPQLVSTLDLELTQRQSAPPVS